jgi:xylulokinase
MAVILSAASCLSWATGVLGASIDVLLREAEDAWAPRPRAIFLPYLSGERTPHNDPHAMGVFFGLTHSTTRGELALAVLEGVAFAFADGWAALARSGQAPEEVSVIGGGSASRLWGRILASVLGCTLQYREGSRLGPAFGAARLARVAHTAEAPIDVCTPPELTERVQPEPAFAEHYADALERYRALYPMLKPAFASRAVERNA